MNNKNCSDCGLKRHCRDSAASWIFFFIGIVATFSVRLVGVLMDINTVYAKVAWYLGVICFFAFFLYKFNAEKNRARLVIKSGLIQKLRARAPLDKGDYELAGSVLCSLRNN